MPLGLVVANAEYVDFGNPSVLPDGASPRSWSGWVRTTTTSGTFAWAFAYGSGGTSQSFGIGRAGTTLFGIGQGDDITFPNFFTVNQWHHVAHTYNGTTARLYGDGVEVASGAKTWNLVRLQAFISRRIGTAGQYWAGQIDDVRVYDRVLSADEIAEIHALRGKDRIDNGLVFGARLDEFGPGVTIPDTADIIRDRSGNDNHGTPVNTPLGAEGILSFGRMVA